MEHLYLYKYVPYNEGSLRIITENTLKYTHPSEFNDPFDCAPDIDPAIASDIVKYSLQSTRGRGGDFTPAKRLMNKRKYARALQKKIEDGTLWKEQIDSIGIVSLTTKPTNLLMWAHYANHHTGFVVEFKIPITAAKQAWAELYAEHIAQDAGRHLVAFKVEYTNDRPALKPPLPDPVEPSIRACLTKSLHWSYEQEHRVVDINRGPGIHPYTPRRLCSVIAGMRMSDDDLSSLENAISIHNGKIHPSDHISLFRAEPVNGHFELRVPNHPRADEQNRDNSDDQHD
ncbi:hypothetical protein CFI10_11265 [Marinobacterium iners]|uniref:DUF2971 domain-containing protein n=1 Tax=Marinobacterium iners TaxID=48076 RepID=UPI001A9046B1|nr:DUF2971 domain-containing protein [Marinobacterium iners]QSR35567.1 hypothetical protein CFI10_11265 [Marinobacterium iners]